MKANTETIFLNGQTFSREINYKLELIEVNSTKLAGYNYSFGKSKAA